MNEDMSLKQSLYSEKTTKYPTCLTDHYFEDALSKEDYEKIQNGKLSTKQPKLRYLCKFSFICFLDTQNHIKKQQPT